jgi:NADH-quinone oxidoreductase subunit L
VGAFTAILAASIALVQNDIKRVLAYSTVSQLGFMFMASAWALLGGDLPPLHPRLLQGPALPRLGFGDPRHGRRAGHAPHGRLKNKIPVTHWTMFVGSLAIAGIPGPGGLLLQGRDPVADLIARRWARSCSTPSAWPPPHDRVLHVAADVHDLLRQVPRGPKVEAAHPRIALPVMTVPLMVLAAGSVFAGWIGVPKIWSGCRKFPRLRALAGAGVRPRRPAHGGRAHHHAATEWLLMALSVAVAVGASGWRVILY